MQKEIVYIVGEKDAWTAVTAKELVDYGIRATCACGVKHG